MGVMTLKSPILTVFGLGMLAAATMYAQGPAAPATTNDAVFTDAQAKRGEELYQQQCSSCHDAQLTGSGTAPALTGADFNANWKDETLATFSDRIRTTMPADNPGSLNRQQASDIVAFILGFNKYPAGQSELTSDAEALKAIKIAPAK
jgi:mono/diheme cytochrome c family protein